ncbi:MAG: Clp protease N-terminal domain-containing protein, partial [Acidimicrobiia bacterium]
MRLLKIGGDEAIRLGQHWLGPEHTLLGILRGDPDDVARRALERAGVDAAMVEGWITRMDTKKEEDTERSGVTPNPR